MIMRSSKLLYILPTLLLCLSGCMREELEESEVIEEGKEMLVRINYGTNVDNVTVTKAGLDVSQEDAIYSIYVMTFNEAGTRTNNTDDALFYRSDDGTQQTDKIWTPTVANYSQGYIQFQAQAYENTTVYAVANVNTADLTGLYSLSSDDLDKIKTLDQLQALIVGLNNNAVSRGSKLMMFGTLKESETSTVPKEIDIDSSTDVQEFSTLYFERLDAKVEFNVSIDNTNGYSEFELDLHSWQVFNVPFNTKLIKGTQLGDGLTSDDGLKVFNTSASNQFDNGSSFTFYMLESNLAPESSLTSYAQREEKNKMESGAYELDTDNNWSWKYSPALAPYVQIKGRLSYKQNNTSGTQDHIHADVVYNVHLGDFGNSNSNFWIIPNTHYTYNIKVKGANNITVEVETSNDDTDGVTESQPGAEGNVVLASGGNIHEVDAHYAQILIPFTYNQTFLDAMGGKSSIEDLTWYVSTPYSEGTYQEDANDNETWHYDDQYLDYKWVEFYVSSTETMVTYGEYLKWLYDNGRATYSGGEYTKTDPLYLKELVDELKAWYNYMSGNSTDKPNIINAGTPNTEQKIYVTAFVNEFYYDNGNPLSTDDNDIPAMVRKVVNGDDRYMHILSNVDYSADGASSLTNSAATIIQKPIRSIYNIPDFGLIDGYDLIWGTETISEKYGATRNGYGEDSDGLLYGTITNTNATSTNNGRLNTYYLWGSGTGKWENRMEISNNVWTMKNANTASANPAVYACLARNRDENGNGTIDVDEMRWYMAAIDQLQYLYIGEYVMHSDAKLLPTYVTTGYPYFHYLSSTYKSGQGGWILWAEEGLSTSGNTPGWNSGYIDSDKNGDYVLRYTRCLRNLGEDGNTVSAIGNNMSPLISSANNVITPAYLNSDALRNEKWTDATLIHEDRTDLNLPYVGGMEYYTSNSVISQSQNGDYNVVYNGIYDSSSCPDNYRVPNQRELALMYINGLKAEYIQAWSSYIFSATYNWYKTDNDGSGYLNFAGITPQGFTAAPGTDNNSIYTRCIRDVDAANPASAYTNGGSLTE